jgi:predicted transposase/invertase (TIGR01784 family)
VDLKKNAGSAYIYVLVDGAFSYLIGARETDEIKQLLTKINIEIPDYKEGMMTYAEELRREGEQRGKQEGIQLRKQKAQVKIAQTMLNAGFKEDEVAKITHLSLDIIKTLH